MTDHGSRTQELLASLQERAKELHCLYEVEELLKDDARPTPEVLAQVVHAIPPGWKFPEVCEAEIVLGDQRFVSRPFQATVWVVRADIVVQQAPVGTLAVYYTKRRPDSDVGPFLKEEVRLVRSLAERLSSFMLHRQIAEARQAAAATRESLPQGGSGGWRGAVALLRGSDRELYLRTTRKLVNHLYWTGLDDDNVPGRDDEELALGEVNVPDTLPERDESWLLTDGPFELAARLLGDSEVVASVQRWIVEDRASLFTRAIHDERTSLTDVADALRRYHHIADDVACCLPDHSDRGLRVALIRRLLTEQLDYIMVAKEYIDSRDMARLLDRMIVPVSGTGKVGGKAAGLFLAERILATDERSRDLPITTPRTWYVASSGLEQFFATNDLADVRGQKYKRIEEVRHDYPHIVRLFRRSGLPPEVVRGLSLVLNEVGTRPVIVRSSSLLEDRVGTAFSGKYKSLFLANQGSEQERLEALGRAVTEVYASTFGPDPIEYRREHGLLDFSEEMGIVIQEVVGTTVGRWFLPAFAGVAFSNNEFRWSPRIARDDGLLRIVPGLGSRAVDRVSDDYPILAVPRKPGLRVNASVDEVIRYSPRFVDVIDLQEGRFDTVAIDLLLRDVGTAFPAFSQVFSVRRGDVLKRASPMLSDPSRDELAATFAGLFEATPFLTQIATILDVLQEKLGKPVDIEFAHDGHMLHLLQCRTQSPADDCAPAPLPRDVPPADIIFSADRHVSNGWLPDLTHIVYVDPLRYSSLGTRAEMLEVGRAVGRLNKLLPKRRFALLGPGRWGSRGDIKLGVPVTYSDISNTALLVEIARRKGNYEPDLSFGTHFFQDLVESSIRYLPLHPDDGTVFSESFFLDSPNVMADMLPDLASLADVVRVIDVAAATGGRALRVLMNADLDQAMAILVLPGEETLEGRAPPKLPYPRPSEQFWRCRLQMAEALAAAIDPQRFGVAALYVFGSTANASAGPTSDIDILVHFRGAPQQRRDLEVWLEGWSLSLGHLNWQRTGHRCAGLLDLHFVTDADIANRTTWAARIGAVTDPARPLPMGADATRKS